MSRIKEPMHQKEFIRTSVRIKPIAPNEQKVFYPQDSQTIVSKTGAKFTYNHVFDDKSSTDYIYEVSAKPIIQQSLRGYNGCIMAYGQTCSGKTHTMKGTLDQPGIVPLALSDIFKTMKNDRLQAKIQVSYMEIYNEKVYDLLADTTVQVNIQSNESSLVFTNLNMYWVESFQQAIGYFNKGEQKRKFASNNLNLNSSRSHTIFRINITVLFDTFQELNAQIDLVDLAGSQGIDKTKNQKISKTQGENINKSLLALSRIITVLSEKRDDKTISFRQSKLTRILQKSICQNSKSSIICMINPTDPNLQESINTLKFGQNALKIKIQAKQNINRNVQAIKEPYLGKMNFLPSEKIELEEARASLKQNQIHIHDLKEKISVMEHQNYNLESQLNMVQNQHRKAVEQLQNCREKHSNQANQWERYRSLLVNRIQNHEAEIQRLQKIYQKVKQELKIVQKNQKSLVESLAQSENLCMHLNNQIKDIMHQMNEETNKLSKLKPQKQSLFKDKPQPQPKKNPFHLAPYKHDPNRQKLDPNKLAWIFRLKNQVIELNRKVQEYAKANIEIAEQIEQLRHKNDELEDKLEKQQVTGKINPQSLEYQEIKRLKRKVGSLKEQFRLAQVNEKKYRDILKKDSTRNLVQMQEYEEWYEKKYGGLFLVNQQTQTDCVGQMTQELYKLPIIFARIQERQVPRQRMQIEEKKNPFMSAAVATSPTKSEVLSRNRGQVKNKPLPSMRKDNPESHRKRSNKKIAFGSSYQEYENENDHINIDERLNMKYQASRGDRDSVFLSNNSAEQWNHVDNSVQNFKKHPSSISQNGNSSCTSERNMPNKGRGFFIIDFDSQENQEQKDVEI